MSRLAVTDLLIAEAEPDLPSGKPGARHLTPNPALRHIDASCMYRLVLAGRGQGQGRRPAERVAAGDAGAALRGPYEEHAPSLHTLPSLLHTVQLREDEQRMALLSAELEGGRAEQA